LDGARIAFVSKRGTGDLDRTEALKSLGIDTALQGGSAAAASRLVREVPEGEARDR
jgi:hypothetical protein